ncbi:MAG: adenylyltransferase/cytidyltransferase family protein [Patescibacteria group bacterium]
MTRVLVFGAFDGLHKGHESFLRQAGNLGDFLVVSLAKDEVIQRLKGREPSNHFDKRRQALEDLGIVDEVLPGDISTSEYSMFVNNSIDIVAFGYDQKELKADLEQWLSDHNQKITLVTLKAFKPEKYKSTILRGLTQE